MMKSIQRVLSIIRDVRHNDLKGRSGGKYVFDCVWRQVEKSDMAAHQGQQTSSDVEEIDGDPQQDIPHP